MREARALRRRVAIVVLAALVAACRPAPAHDAASTAPARDAAAGSPGVERAQTPDGAGDEAAADSGAPAVIDAATLARVAVRHQTWPGGRIVHETQPAVWRTRVPAGSLMKLATTVAAIDVAHLDPAMRLSCRRRERVGGRVLDCVHPPLAVPLSIADALAHSCNSVFLQVAARLSREDLVAGLARLGIGADVGEGPPALAALGLDGVEADPAQWGAAIVRLARGETRVSPAARGVLLEGLRRAVTEGTARGLGVVRPDALAKTSTAPLPDGTVRATVALAWPRESPGHSLVVAAAGVSGRDAVVLAAAWLHRERLAVGDAAPASPAAGREGGRVRVGRAGVDGYRVETMALEDYVAAVVAGEAPGRGPAALYDAMAIVARTFVAAHGQRHQGEGFDVCDLTHCQVLGPIRSATREAAARTRGLVMADAGQPRRVYYHASCAGWLEPAERVWPRGSGDAGSAPRRDPAGHVLETWTSEVRALDLERALGAAGLRGDLDGIALVRSGTTGRVERVRVRGMQPAEMTGEVFRGAVGRALGWQVLKSAYFTVTPASGGFRFSGAGRGHGVGLCVRGALELAEAGQSAREILAAYMPGAELVTLDGATAPLPPPRQASRPGAPAPMPAFTLQLPASVEPARDRLERLIARLLGELGARLGATPPDTLTIRFHPTHESFRRATGQAPWVSGITEGTVRIRGEERTTASRVELMPLALLERRGELEKTVRHELAHALTGPTLVGRPRWVHEGVVVWATGELTPHRGEGCPLDREFDSAASSVALGRLYARAAGCVADAIARGTAWRDIGR